MEKAPRIISRLGLVAHPDEGGYFRETYRSRHSLVGESLPPAYKQPRSLATAIYFLLTADTCSRMHRLPGDEIFHFYGGDPVEMLLLKSDGSGEVNIIGGDVLSGQSPQLLVPAGCWQGARLRPGGEYALLGTTMSPGYEAVDFTTGDGAQLCREYPAYAEMIEVLTA